MDILIFVIYVILLISFFLLITDFLRRIKNKFYYTRKDHLKEKYGNLVREYLVNRDEKLLEEILRNLPEKRINREALIEVLIQYIEFDKEAIKQIFNNAGLKNFYINKLKSNIALERGEAYKILGYFECKEELELLLERVEKESDPEVLFVGLVSLAKLIDRRYLERFLEILEKKTKEKKLNIRSIEIIINEVSRKFIDDLCKIVISRYLRGDLRSNEKLVYGILDGLYFSPLSSILFKNLSYEIFEKTDNPELIARALKLLLKISDHITDSDEERLIGYLSHPEWIVRLHTIRLLKNRDVEKYIQKIIPLLSDRNYLVRKETAEIIANFLISKNLMISELIKTEDRYAYEILIDILVRKAILEDRKDILNKIREFYFCLIESNPEQRKELSYGTNL